MKSFIEKLSAFMLLATASATGSLQADTYGFQAGIGFRQDSIHWNMDQSCTIDPRVKSNLHFNDLEIFLLGAKFKGLIGQSLYARCAFDYGFICDGKMREKVTLLHREDVQTFGNNGIATENEYDRFVTRNHEHGTNYVWDLNIALGMPFNCICSEFNIAPMVGFSYDRQHLKFHNHYSAHIHDREIISGEHYVGKKRGNTFSTGWWGPMVGLDASYVSQEGWSAFGEFEFHFGRLKRERHTSLGVSHIDHYQRTKDFWGTTWKAGFNYIVCEDIYVEAAVNYSNWKSWYHRDHFSWSSGSVRCDLGYMF